LTTTWRNHAEAQGVFLVACRCCRAQILDMSRDTRSRAVVGLFGAVCLLAALAACTEGIVAPVCDLCDEFQLRTDRKEYGMKSIVRFTITNRTNEVMRYDWCSVTAVGRTSDILPFETFYRRHSRCGPGADLTDVIEHMRTLASGESTRDSVMVPSGAYQGEYQVQLWPIDAAGALTLGGPTVSNSFIVLPTNSP
jgi:hypothetical protein